MQASLNAKLGIVSYFPFLKVKDLNLARNDRWTTQEPPSLPQVYDFQPSLQMDGCCPTLWARDSEAGDRKTKTYQIIWLILNIGSTSIVLANVSYVIF